MQHLRRIEQWLLYMDATVEQNEQWLLYIDANSEENRIVATVYI